MDQATKRRKQWKAGDWCIAAVFLVQAAVLLAANLLWLRASADFDTSSFYSAAIEMWRQKRLILSDYAYGTSLMLDTSVPLAALLYGLTGDIFTAYGLANILVMAATLWVLWKLMGLVMPAQRRLPAYCMAGFLLLTPYSAGIVGYLEIVVWGYAAYNVRLLLMVAALYIVQAMEQKRAVWGWMAAFTFGTFVTAVSSSLYFWQSAILPLLCAEAVDVLRRNDLRFYRRPRLIFLAAQTAVTALGAAVARLAVPVDRAGNFIGGLQLAGPDQLAGNVSGLLAGAVEFWGAPAGGSSLAQQPSQLAGLVRLFVFAGVLCLALVWLAGQVHRKWPGPDRERLTWDGILIAAVISAVQLVLAPLYGWNHVHGRYLLLAWPGLVLLAVWMIEALLERGKTLFYGAAGLLCAVLLLANCGTVLYPALAQDLSWRDEILDYIQEQEGTVLVDYCQQGFYQTGRSAFALTDGAVFGIDCSEDGTPRLWGNSVRLFDAGRRTGWVFALAPEGSEQAAELAAQMTYCTTIAGQSLYKAPAEEGLLDFSDSLS